MEFSVHTHHNITVPNRYVASIICEILYGSFHTAAPHNEREVHIPKSRGYSHHQIVEAVERATRLGHP